MGKRGQKAKLVVEGVGPTSEQAARFVYELGAVREGTVLHGHAFKRRPLFETMFTRGDIDADILEALRYYRNAYENADRSETRCTLNRNPGGGSSDAVALRLIMAKEARDDCEAAIPAFLIDTMRAVVLRDMSFSQVAQERWGMKEGWAEKRKPTDEKVWVLQPASSRQRDTISKEFKLGAYVLHTAIASRISTTDGRKKHVASVAAA